MARYKKYFIQAIENHFPENSGKLIGAAENHYALISIDTQFAATSNNPIDKRLDFCAYFLALIKTLDEQGEAFETIRTICLEVTTEYVRPKNKIQQMVKQLPPKLINTWAGRYMLGLFNKKVSHNSNPNGFLATIITDKSETFGFGYGIDIMECGICKLFSKHHYFRYASILCEVDKMTSGFAGLELIRTGTIANGAEICDFRFKKLIPFQSADL